MKEERAHAAWAMEYLDLIKKFGFLCHRVACAILGDVVSS